MLSAIIFCPIILGISLFFIPKNLLKPSSTFLAFGYFCFTLILFYLFDSSQASFQLSTEKNLIPFLGIKYFLGLDGISFWYVILTAFLLPFSCFFSDKPKAPLYYALLFFLCSCLQGAFLSLDLVLFFIFFEMSLLPLFFLIYLWGGKDRVFASFKFILYTFFASLFFLVGLVSLMMIAREGTGVLTASLLDFYQLDLIFVSKSFFNTQTLLFFLFAIAFAVKTPLVPFHTWLPLAHVEAPTSASVYLAALVLKVGTYAWFRFVIPLFPEASVYYSNVFLFLSCFGLIYASCLAFAQKDMKKLIAYSSVAHMAYVLIGLFSFNIQGLEGAYYQTLTHGITSAALFFGIGILYEKSGSRKIDDFGGLAVKLPLFSSLFFCCLLALVGLPFTGSFVAEFLVLLSSFLSGGPWVYVLVCGVIFSAVYSLSLFRRAFLGQVSVLSQKLKDLSPKEMVILIPFVILIFVMGIFPNFFFQFSKKSLENLNKNKFNYHMEISKNSLKDNL